MSYFWFIVGAVVGSFLNVCIHRLPRRESIIFPSSHCTNCGAKLSPLDLIPILGYFFLKGHCRYCQSKISFRYPLVEFLTAVLFSFSWLSAGGDVFKFVFQAVFVSALLVIFFTDLEEQVIPDAVSVLGVISGLIYNRLDAVPGMLLGFVLLFLIGKLGRFLFRKEAMGEGDWYVAVFLGACLRWDGALLSIFLAYLLAAAVAVIFLVAGKVKMGQYVPFGPALAVGGIVTLFLGERIVGWYLGLFI